MRRGTLALVLALPAAAAWAAAPPAKWRDLAPEETKEVAALSARLHRHAEAGEFEQAARVAARVADYRRRRQGEAHWQAVAARYEAERARQLAAVPRERRAEVVRAGRLQREGISLTGRGRPREAEKLFRQALAIYEEVLGASHPFSAASRNNVALCLHAQGKAAEALAIHRSALADREKALGPGHPDTAQSYNNVASCLEAQGKAAAALPLYRRALGIREDAQGPWHPDTATACANLAACLQAQGKAAEALVLHRKALVACEKALGAGHVDTAQRYDGLGSCLLALGRASEALPLHRKALAIREKALGPDHPGTATSCNNLGGCLKAQGRYAEALPLFKRALAIREKALGPDHPGTANGCNNVAGCLLALGRTAEALALHREALAILEKVLGPDHPDTADSYNNIASCLLALGEASEALPLYRRALKAREKSLGTGHPRTATTCSSLALCLDVLGRSAEALPLHRRSLKALEEALGPDHLETARRCNNLAYCLQGLGRPAEALPLHRRSLKALEEALGPGHPDAVISCHNVAHCLWLLGRRGEAARLLQSRLRGQEAGRALRADTGFDRAQSAARAPSLRASLASLLAGLKQPRNAFAHAEGSLARGLLDDLAGLGREEGARAAGLRTRLARLEPDLASFSLAAELTEEQKARHDALKREHGRLWAEWSGLLAAASARGVLPLHRIQGAIPPDAALVLWVDDRSVGERWGCVVRREGTPAWEQLAGSGKGGAWREEDAALPERLYTALTDPASDAAGRHKLLDAFRKQRLEPLRAHLRGVNQLFVVPTGAVAYVPAELLAPDLPVSYVPSGTFLARAVESHRAVGGSPLLALGDPSFDRGPLPEPPSPGVLVKEVQAGGNAAKAGLRPGDVLLSVGGTRIDSFDELQGAFRGLPAAAKVWRDGRTVGLGRLEGGPLGASFDPRSARAAVRAWRRERGAAPRGTGHKRLPGTRLEVEAVAALVKGGTVLLGSDASEQRLDELIDQGKLKGYRILHLATHGEVADESPGRSALILAQDRLPDPLEQARQGKRAYDGRLTVERVRQRWDLDCDLVVLSACETALGKDAQGDGLLGFAHAFLSRGARSVVLSRWKVDDAATALLMVRFYENLLARRKGLKQPMGRAAALAEAKKWMRELPRVVAERLATLHSGGALRGSEGDQKPPPKAKPVALKGDKPYEHPFYWAAFTLVGDPD